MKWGAWHKSQTGMNREAEATCEAATHEQASQQLAAALGVLPEALFIEPLTEPGKSHVARFYTQTGPVLDADDLRS